MAPNWKVIMQQKKFSKHSISAWCLYDWANSSFFTIVITFIFPVYFTNAVVKNSIQGSAYWGYAIGLSGLIIALCSPILGSIADKKGQRKPWIASFTVITVFMSALLWFIKPAPDYISLMLFLIVTSTVAIEIATIFYNAMLRDISPPPILGRISGLAWGMGYFGGLTSLSVALFLLIKANVFDLNIVTSQPIRMCGPLVSLWLLIFSLPMFFLTQDKAANNISLVTATKQGLMELIVTLRRLKHYKNIIIFLLAHMLYIDGLNTLFAFGGIYATGTFGFTIDGVIGLGIAMNVSAGVGAILFSWLDDSIGSKKIIIISLLCIILFGILLLIVHRHVLFWILALSLSVFIGPVQASSRSLMARLAPKQLQNEMFGFYALSGKITAFLGPWLFGYLTLKFSSQRIGMIAIIILMLSGTLMLIPLKEKMSSYE